MLPRWHVLLGAIFTLAIKILFPDTSNLYLALLFLSSVFIDLDHYANAVLKTKKFGLRNAFEYHKIMAKIALQNKLKNIRNKGDFELFHTIEFHILIFLLGFVWAGFFYILIGMIFHSICDIISIWYDDCLYAREFIFFNWLAQKIRTKKIKNKRSKYL